jgi:hypothetical protein
MSRTVRTSTPVPVSSSGPIGSTRVYDAPMWITSDGANVKIKMANRTYSAGAGASATVDIAVYEADLNGDPIGSPFATFPGFVVPGDGTFRTSAPFTPVRGVAGKIAIVFSFPDPTFVASAHTGFGKYALGTSTVSPPPAWTGANTTSIFWLELEYETEKQPITVNADSLGPGYTPTDVVGFANAAWNQFASARDQPVHVQGVVQYGSLQNYANNVGLPYLHDEVVHNGADEVWDVGTNDLLYNDLPTMQAALITCIAIGNARFARRQYTKTIPPQTGYPGTEAVRLGYNAWLLANWESLGLSGIYDEAAAQSQGGLASDSDLSTMASAFDSGDLTHPNLAGHVQMFGGWNAVIPVEQSTAATAVLPPAIDYILTHEDDAVARLIGQFQDKPRLVALVRVLAHRYQLLEDALWQILTESDVDNAEGATLEDIGNLVGQSRNGSPDPEYRVFIKARIRANRSSGRLSDLLAISSLILDAFARVAVYVPSALKIEADDVTVNAYVLWNDFLNRAKGAAKNLDFAYSKRTAATTLKRTSVNSSKTYTTSQRPGSSWGVTGIGGGFTAGVFG